MLRPKLVCALVLVLAAASQAQVPAPDFVIDFNIPSLNTLQLGFHAQGIPYTPVQILMTFDDPFSTPPEQIIIYPFITTQLDGTGQCNIPLTIPSWQGPLPDVWFGAVLLGPQGLVLPELIHLSGMLGCIGCGNLLATHSHVFGYERLSQTMKVRVFGSNGPYSVWEVNGPCPQVGMPWNAGANANLLGHTTANGANSDWSGAVTPPVPPATKCIVIRSNGVNGVVIGVHHL